MINRTHDLSLARQATLLGMARSTVYYAPRPVSPGDLAVMRRLDELHLDYQLAGARMLRAKPDIFNTEVVPESRTGS